MSSNVRKNHYMESHERFYIVIHLVRSTDGGSSFHERARAIDRLKMGTVCVHATFTAALAQAREFSEAAKFLINDDDAWGIVAILDRGLGVVTSSWAITQKGFQG